MRKFVQNFQIIRTTLIRGWLKFLPVPVPRAVRCVLGMNPIQFSHNGVGNVRGTETADQLDRVSVLITNKSKPINHPLTQTQTEVDTKRSPSLGKSFPTYMTRHRCGCTTLSSLTYLLRRTAGYRLALPTLSFPGTRTRSPDLYSLLGLFFFIYFY